MLNLYPLHSIEPLFRPPSEGRSLILQVTNGCSWNKCSYCEMYTDPQKKFRAKKDEQILEEICRVAAVSPDTDRVFLADGDAMVLSTHRLLTILAAIRQHLPAVSRVTAYCLPRNLRRKSLADMEALHQAGLHMLYVGAESGDDEVLRRVHKGETLESTAEALNKIRDAGIKASVMLLNGLGGTALWEQHALNSAKLVNATQPHYLATLVLDFPKGQARFKAEFGDDFQMPDQQNLFRELAVFIAHTELENTIFRSNHASNYLPLHGVLGKDKERLLDLLQLAQERPSALPLRQEWQRGL